MKQTLAKQEELFVRLFEKAHKAMFFEAADYRWVLAMVQMFFFYIPCVTLCAAYNK